MRRGTGDRLRHETGARGGEGGGYRCVRRVVGRPHHRLVVVRHGGHPQHVGLPPTYRRVPGLGAFHGRRDATHESARDHRVEHRQAIPERPAERGLRRGAHDLRRAGSGRWRRCAPSPGTRRHRGEAQHQRREQRHRTARILRPRDATHRGAACRRAHGDGAAVHVACRRRRRDRAGVHERCLQPCVRQGADVGLGQDHGRWPVRRGAHRTPHRRRCPTTSG